MQSAPHRRLHLLLALAAASALATAVYEPAGPRESLPNRLPQAAPYLTAEAESVEPPFERFFRDRHNPGKCATCHGRIFEQWNGSMMSSSWRDPAWRGAFLLVARLTSTAGNCDTPQPPDGTERARPNPFADGDRCSSTFDLGTGHHTLARPGSLLDGFCSQCHMPSNYADNVPPAGVEIDPLSGLEHGQVDPGFNPTSDNGTGLAFATLESQLRNTETGKRGIFCAACHSMADTREMPFGQHNRSGGEAAAILGAGEAGGRTDRHEVPDPSSPTLGYAVGAGSYRMSPNALATSQFLGPLAAAGGGEIDPYLSGVFGIEVPVEPGAFEGAGHTGAAQPLQQRAEFCGTCHDVTNPLPIKNRLGRWVGGFPIERTYTEWASSRYADRPGNMHFDPRFKRDCQTCHMQQDYGQPGTAQTLYRDGRPAAPLTGSPADDGPLRKTFFSHHFIGGNAYVSRLIGADVDELGGNQPYPELSVYSFSSADETSPYHNAYWTNVADRGPATQHARLAWDRLRNVLEMDLSAPAAAAAGSRVPLRVRVTNSGSGHNFPSGFPEGRNAWVAVRAFDLATGRELPIHDAVWRRTSLGVGLLTAEDRADPNFPGCEDHELPAGSPDPFAVQFRAVASLGDGCPTLELPYATPLNLTVGRDGLPVDAEGRRIDRRSPRGLPVFRDLDGDGDRFDDSYLLDTRLRPLPHPQATADLDRYAVVIPPGTHGPVAVTAAVYYQSLEGVVAKKFLGNLADTDEDHRLEPCVLGGACDGRTPTVEPAVVEGAPPVPMEVRSRVIEVRQTGGRTGADTAPPGLATYPRDGAADVYRDVVVKAFFSEPVAGVDAASFTLTDEQGVSVPAFVDQIGAGAWALFPHRVFLQLGQTYTARLAAGVCDQRGNCTPREVTWRFTVTADPAGGSGNTAVPEGFGTPAPAPDPAPRIRAARRERGRVVLAFSEPVMNVHPGTVRIGPCGPRGGVGAALPGRLVSDAAGRTWTWTPAKPPGADLCASVTAGVYDLKGKRLAPWTGKLAASRPPGNIAAVTSPGTLAAGAPAPPARRAGGRGPR